MSIKRFLLSLAALVLVAAGSAYAVQITGTNSEMRRSIVRVGMVRLSVTDTITAFAGGGQTSAVQLDSAYNRVTTVASANDSVKLPSCVNGATNTGTGTAALPSGNTVGVTIWVTNAAASNSMNLYPATGDAINALSANSAYAMAANKTSAFVCGTAGIWYSLLGS